MLQGLIYGAETVTFLKYQSMILDLIYYNILNHPFYSWECVSLKLEERTLDF